MTHSLLIGASIAALVTGHAHAQEPGAGSVRVEARTPAAQAETGQPDDPQAADPRGLADIIVTATKVETTLQKTPQAITTIDGSALVRAGIATAQDLNKLVPGLQIEQNGSASSIYIRGIGSRVLNPSSDPAVAFSVDGVYYSRASGTSATLFDLDRVEVVKGPQGTLYGRNATGGALNVVTNRPRIGERSMAGEIEVGNYQQVRATAAVNVPLGDSAALRLAGQTVYNNGFLSDGYNDTNLRSLRASVLIAPSDAFSIFVSGDYAEQGGQGPGVVPIGPGGNNTALRTRFVVPGDPFTGPSDPRVNAVLATAAPAQAVPGPTPGTFCRAQVVGPPTAGGVPARLLCTYPSGVAPIAADGYLDNRFYGLNITAEADVGFGELTAIAGYRGTEVEALQRVDFGRQNQQSAGDQYSGELRLGSSPGSGAFQWLVGGFYLYEQQSSRSRIASNDQVIPVPNTCATAPVGGFCVARPLLIQRELRVVDPKVTNETYAGFGQATLSVTEWLRLTGGVRFTHERKAAERGQITLAYTFPPGLNRTYASQGSVAFDDTSYRAGVEIDLAPRSMLYAHYSTAFHAGGFNIGVREGPNRYEYDPEKVKSYVVGIKNRFFDNRLQLNVEAFWLDYANYQQNSLGYVNDGSPACSGAGIRTACPLTLRTDNAAEARIRGVEGDILLRVVEGGTVGVNILYNDAKFLRFDVPSPLTGLTTSFAGARLPGANTLTISAGYTQEFRLTGGDAIVASARTQYRNGAFLWYTNAPSQFQEGFTRTDLTLGYEAQDRRWSLTGFVRNVEGDATLLQGGPVNGATGLFFTNLNPPRTYGATLGFNF